MPPCIAQLFPLALFYPILELKRSNYDPHAFGSNPLSESLLQGAGKSLMSRTQSGTSSHSPWKAWHYYLVCGAFQDCVSDIHDFSLFLFEVFVPATLIQYFLPVLPHQRLCILSVEHPGLKTLQHLGCSSPCAAETKYLFSRNEKGGLVIARNQHFVQKWSHVVVLVQMDGLVIMRRELNGLCPFSIHGLGRFFHILLPYPGRHEW